VERVEHEQKELAMTVLHQVLVHLRAGRWNEAHNLVQSDASPLAAWLHGILHVQEGDLEDAEYWYGKAGRHFRSRGTLEHELDCLESKLSIESFQNDQSPAAGS
jgi:hypothetical protein